MGQSKLAPKSVLYPVSKVEFVDGSIDDVDVVIAATGYDISLPFFNSELQGDAQKLELYRGIMHPQHHNLYFVGLIMGLCSNWPYSEQQAKWVAAHLSGDLTLPKPHKMARRMSTPASLSRNLLNCQLAAEELRSDRQSCSIAAIRTDEQNF
jgi:Flavin-binding monooxygenase-like